MLPVPRELKEEKEEAGILCYISMNFCRGLGISLKRGKERTLEKKERWLTDHF